MHVEREVATDTIRDTVVTANETYENWRCFSGREPLKSVIEARLYTDVWLIGELTGLGPYSFFNTIALPHQGLPRPAVVLRVGVHFPQRPPSMPMSDDFEHYHGGDFIDEMAALASLFLGIRMQAGPVDREFVPGGDPLGRPIQYGPKAAPVLPPPAAAPQIPRLRKECNLIALKSMESFPARSVLEANTLVKAARLYQQAVWVCDSAPRLAWHLLISAVETAAVVWSGSEDAPRDRLQVWLPKLYKILETSKCPDLIDPIADILTEYTRSTKKFIDFLVEFSPEPPSERPTKFLRFSFSRKDMSSAAGVIYGHRSKSLHSGTAFPLPMCTPPQLFSFDGKQDPAHQEVPAGMAVSSRGSTWPRDQTPMLLHIFEYLARGALLRWWGSLEEGLVNSASSPA
jgi:hypothetical protein